MSGDYRLLITISLLVFLQVSLIGQHDNVEIDLSFIEDYISEELEILEDIPLEDIYDYLRTLQRNPLNINRVELDDFKELIILTDQQALQILNHRSNYGPFISLLELQTIPGFEIDFINNLTPFLTIGGEDEKYQVNFKDLLTKGKNELFLRYGQTLDEQRGYVIDPDQGRSFYAGNQMKLYSRFRHQYENKFSAGFTLEKDPGEEFFKGSNPQGFDFMSFHASLTEINRTVRYFSIGDFSMSLGQGLIYYSRFASRKSSFVTSIKRKGNTFHPYTSLNEFNFMRGVAVTLNINPNLEFSTFISKRKLDSNIRDLPEDEITEISNITESGLHRTPNEIAREGNLGRLTFGGILKYKIRNGHVGLQVIHYKLDKFFAPTQRSYNTNYFRGQSLTNLSADYERTFKNVHLFGEVGWGNSTGMIHGALITLSRNADLAIIYRNLPPDFHTFHGSTFAESSQNSNEEGLYLGVSFKPHRRWMWNTYVDFFKHPWLRFRVNKPSTGQEALSRVSYNVKRKLQIYFQYKYETKERNLVGSDNIVVPVIRYHKHNLRLHSGYKIGLNFEWRIRGEYVIWNDINSHKDGMLVYQDIIYKPLGKKFSCTGRVAYFNTDDFDTRLYAYENDLSYNYGIPAFFYEGIRYYFNTRIKLNNINLEARYSYSKLLNRDSFGSGLNEISNNSRSDIKLQMRISF